MSELHLEYCNDTYCRVKTTDAISYELNELFSFFVPGYQFMPAYKDRAWDGKINLFNEMNGLLMLGHIAKTVEFCKREKVKFSIDQRVINQLKNIDYCEDEVNEFLDSIDITLKNGKRITLYDEQRKAVHLAIKNNRVLLISPTSSGKSLITFLILEWYLRKDYEGQFLVTVPLVPLVKQLAKNFLEYIHEGCVMQPEDIHEIFGSKEKTTNHKITISTWQGIHKLPKTWFRKFGLSICDEAHLAKGQSLQTIHKNLVNAKVKIGMTGTLDDTKLNPLIIEGATGKTTIITTTKELMDQGKVTPLRIKSVFLDYSYEESFEIKKFKYPEEMKYISYHDRRTQKICDITHKMKGNALLLYKNIEHGEILYECMKKSTNKKVYLLHGKYSVKQRDEIIDIMEKNDNVVVIATYGIFSTGVSINNVHHVGLVSPTKSKIRTLQSVGRGLRLDEGKDFVTLWDFVDDFTYLKRGGKNTHENYAYLHGVERLNYYIQQEFTYKIYKISL